MKIGLLSQWYDPEPGPAAVPGVLARSLAARGHDVVALTGYPNYPEGRIYAGYRQRMMGVKERTGRVAVHRVPLYPSHDNRFVHRSANYLSFATSASIKKKVLRDAEAVWVYNSPATVPLVAASLQHRYNTPYLLHLMDVWPDSVIESGMSSRLVYQRAAGRMLSSLVTRGYSRAKKIAVTSEGQLSLLISRGVPASRLEYCPLWADEEIYFQRPSDRSVLPEPAREASMVWMYAGAMGHVQGIDHAIRAAARAVDAGVHLVLVGHGIAERSLRELVSDLGVQNVHFLGRRDPSVMGEVVAAADVHLVSLADTPLMRVTMPSKIQSILAAGRPIIATCAGDAAREVDRSGAGVAIPPGDVDQLTDCIRRLAGDRQTLDEWSAASRSYYDQTFSRDVAVRRVEDLLREVAS